MSSVIDKNNKYFPAIIVAIVVGACLVIMVVMWIIQQSVKRKPKAEKDSQSYYPEDFYRGFNKKKLNTRREGIEDEVEKDGQDSKDDLEQRLPRPMPRIKTDSTSLPRPETLYSPTRPNSTLLLDEFVAPLFDNNSNNHSQSNLLKSSQDSHEGTH